MPDVLGYARVSTAEQDLEVQRRRLRDEAKAIRIFEDVVSGRASTGPAWRPLSIMPAPATSSVWSVLTGSADH